MNRRRFVGVAACMMVLAASAAHAQQTNLFESKGDLGTRAKPGGLEFDAATGEYELTGAGAGFFTWKRVPGDLTLTADVRFAGGGTAVLMVRQDLTPGSAYAAVALHRDGSASLQFRPAAGAPTQDVRSTAEGAVRIRIQRSGNSFTIAAGKPGDTLTPTGTQSVTMADPVYAGLGIVSQDADILETAIFSNVTLQQPQRYRSRITVYDVAAKKSETIYTADQVIEAPNWSRDGKFLLVNTGGNLYRLPVGTSNPALEKLDLGDGGYRCNNDHDLSRDGKRLAFSASSPNSRQSQVWLANGDGSGAKLMTPLAPSYFHGWSPDGKWLAFVGQREGKYTLFRVPVEGGAEQRLTEHGYDDGPEYSPDGKWIYFNSNRNGGWDIWRMPPDGAGPGDAKAVRVTNDDWEDWFPHFSPNGKWMLVFSFPPGTPNHGDRMEGVALRLMPAPGAEIKPAKPELLVKFFGGQGTINVNSWSPDSRKFAYVVYEKL